MKRTSSWIVGVIAALAAGPWAQAAPKVHPFEPPPSFVQSAPTGSKALALGAVAQQKCNPKGSFTRDGDVVSAKLNLVLADFTINNPDPTDPQKDGEDPVRLRSYGGCKSGPVLDVKPGDTLRVQFINSLDKNDPSCLDTPPAGLSLPPGVGCFNTTNLHTHGLHVSPAGNSDNVLLNIAPETQFPYEINVPRDHPSGTFWYHAHRHGSTAVQVASGASGVLLIRGDRPYRAPTALNPHPIADIDTILHDAKGVPTPEKVFLFQQIAYACFLDDPKAKGGPWQQIYTTKGLYNINTTDPTVANAPWTCPLSTPSAPVTPGVIENFSLQLDSPTIWDTNGRFTSINGVVQPTITVPAGEIQRWRFVHAGIHDTINVQVVRASPVRSTNLIQASALSGNREQQKADLLASCQATAANLIPQFEIAADGLTRVKVRTVRADTAAGLTESNYLQPGYRSDILVVFPSDGDYCLLDQAAPEQERAGNGSGPGGQGPSTPQLLAYIHVRGGQAVTTDLKDYVLGSLAAANPTLPVKVRDGLRKGDLSPWAPFVGVLAPPAPTNIPPQKADFAISGPPPGANNPLFQINGVSYDPDTVNFTRQVNTTDDWLLTSQGEPHIFHIHINPFQVIDITQTNAAGQQESIFDKNGKCKPSVSKDGQGLANQYCGLQNVFKDTLFVENGYQVRVRTYYDRYIGEYVIHCHILDHEDGGMMANIAIVPDLSAPGGGLGMGGMKHNTPTAHH